MPQSNCKKCGKIFYAKPSWISAGNGKYCSNKCSFESRKSGKNVRCNICSKEVYKTRRELNRSKSNKFFCSKSCQTKWRNSFFVGDKHANWKEGRSSYRNVLDRNNIPKICLLCHTKDDRVLEAHHLDRNRRNSNLNNLVWLCRNCHFLIHHYKDEERKIMVIMV